MSEGDRTGGTAPLADRIDTGSDPSDGRLVHAAIGAVVSLVLFFLPFSPALGGGLAGYLHGPDRREGALVGGLSGLIAAVPGAVLFVLVASVFVIAGPGSRSVVVTLVVFFIVGVVFASLYGTILGAGGGVLGALLNEELARPPEAESEPSFDREADSDSEPDSEPESGSAPETDAEPEPDVAEFDEPPR